MAQRGGTAGQIPKVFFNAEAVLKIISGNEDGLFSLDPATGIIRLTSDAALPDVRRTNCTLLVRATNNGSPPFSGTGTVMVNIVPPESINAACVNAEVWTNLAGSNILNLTSQSRYPKCPDVLSPVNGFNFGTIQTSVYGTNDEASVSGQSNFGGALGTRIRAWLTPINSGPYKFSISSHDDSCLLFSSTTNAADAERIAYIAGGATS